MTWNEKLIGLANHISTWSKDKHTQVGCVITDFNHRILSVGYNGFPQGSDDSVEDRYERPVKYLYTEHAERNAIYSAAKNGIRLEGSTIYLNWFPCIDCSRAIIQSGIKKIVCTKPSLDHPVFGEGFKVALELFQECNVTIEYIEV